MENYKVEAWFMTSMGERKNVRSLVSSSKDEINNFIESLPDEYEYKIWKQVFENKL